MDLDMAAEPETSVAAGATASWRTLWLPLRAPGPVWLAALLVGVVYLATMSRDLSFYDSAELALAAVHGGLSHPPGHPLYIMLGWLLAHLPGVPPLLGLNALSAIPAALALVPLASLAERMTGSQAEGGARYERYALPALLAVLALHWAVWEVATRIEVYALAAFFALWAVARTAAMLADAGARSIHGDGDGDGPRATRWLAPGLALGLSAAVNPVIAAITAVSLAPALIAALARGRIRWTAGLVIAAGGLLGCAFYLYIPLVAGRRDAFVWGAPTGGEALWRFITFADFSYKGTGSPAVIARHALAWMSWAAGRGLLPLLALGLVAHLRWGHQAGLGRACTPLALGLTLFFLWRNGVYHPDIADYRGYLMAPLSLLAAGVVALLGRLARVRGRGARPRVLAALLAAVLVLNVAFTAPPLHGRTRHRDHAARLLARGALERAPHGAVVIVASDHWVFPMMYLQEIEGMRPDVVVLARGLSGSSWFWQHLLDRHDELRAFALRGPGGQPARIARFLAANPGRPVLHESWEQAMSLGQRPACAGAWLAGDERACAGSTLPDELTPALEQTLATLEEGAPTTDAVLARIALDRGELLWRMGRSEDAVRALRAGVPPARRPSLPAMDGRLSGVPPLQGPLPPWRESVAIGHYAQNLYLAAIVLAQGGIEDSARSHFQAAAEAGLAEALAP
jgi:hypothetical protein